MDVSVVIINYNTFDLTCKCIQSIIEKTNGISYEIILVDNASKECDPALFKIRFPDIYLIKSTSNLGFSKGNNRGIELASGKVLLLLNSDTELVNNAIELAYKRMSEDPTLGILTVKTVFPNGQLQPVSNPFKTLSYLLRKLFRINKIVPERLYDLSKEHYTDWVWGSFLMIPRKIVDSFPNKKLQEDFFMYGEDVQWCYTVRALGYKVLYYPQATIIHYVSRSAVTIVSDWEKYVNKILPNEYKFYVITKGSLYAYTYYFITGLIYFSWFNREGLKKARFFWSFAFNNMWF